ncbi:hypothetical protein [Enterococcus faecium]|uniref:hypothetical protein n=1 Tax=Enterococcus faecium TaxID=1352 RepID=UPI00191139EC|nr:hypothetical protein [Enterococcus faecium]MBK5028790.1 hypothetical protein [Enterococcus faecium]MBK5039497.1 hypothetical protein [Enterococcus faecium]MBK5044371.1 hypothetical protein [Enterococcus faecium]MBK5069373.1 hypothetical protein [Enterococcus faecium]MBK5132590.1 hypothetical protein [Enterococcus faecium]
MHNKKKFLLVGLFSAVLLGGAVTYGMYSHQPHNETEKTEQPTKSESSKHKNKKSAWEESVKGKEDKKDKNKHSTKKADDILAVIADTPLIKQQPNQNKNNLIDRLAIALDVQTKKESDRQEKLMIKEKKSIDKPVLVDLSYKPQVEDTKPSNKENGKTEINKDENSETDKGNDIKPNIPLPDPLPVPDPNPLPDPTPSPDPNPTPDPEPNPDPEPTPDPQPSIDEQINQSKEELNDSRKQADELNKQLTQVKDSLDNLQNIGSSTGKNVDKAALQWQKVADLVNEYNQLTNEIKKLIEEDGTVLPINYDLYKETYEKLNQKVTEVKTAQKEATNTTNEINKNVEQATDTLNNLEETKKEYQNKQKDVSEVDSNVNSAINHAQSNEQVASAVQDEINQAAQSNEQLNETNKTVGEQLNQVDPIESQTDIASAKEQTVGINNQAEEQNNNVADVMNDFNNLPKPSDSEEPSIPENTDQNQDSTSQPQNIDNASVSQNKIENEQISEKTLPVTNQNSNQSEIEDIQK